MMVAGGDGTTLSFQGGFITFPAATFAADPRGKLITSPAGDVVTTTESPVLRGPTEVSRPYYDAAEDRWLPIAAAKTSPDGASYAYATTGAASADGVTFHVVSVASGAERTITVPVPNVGAANGADVEDFDGTSIYFAVTQVEGYPTGVWRLETGTGKVSAMQRVENVFAVRNGSAYIGYADPHDANPPSVPASIRLFDSLVQVDLATGARTTWFYRPGFAVWLSALDAAGRPVVAVSGGPNFVINPPDELRRLNDPLSGGEDNGDLVYSGGMWFDQPQPDGDRIWLGNDRGIYLYTPSGGLEKVYAFSGPHQSVFPAGFCT
ncbi:MAG TPA: hypothetical protein VKJ07_11685 [Mycobacteriales bacterium]|nr:hypothetical protein [Mycobacteriales bacterium]